MQFLVQLVSTYDGEDPDDKYSMGVIVTDRRDGAHDLVAKANDEWRTSVTKGEIYRITPLAAAREWSVNWSTPTSGEFTMVPR